MRLSAALLVLVSLNEALATRSSLTRRAAGYTVPAGSPGFYHGQSTAAVTFDEYSLFIDGKRVMIFGGEFHPWRQPSVPLWRDTLQKMKAAGLNTVSIYLHWGVSEGKPGRLNLDYYRSATEFYKVAQEVGLYVISRPGPYINAETTAGGIPGWVTNINATVRTNGTEFTQAWRPWIETVAKATAPFQYPDGPVIAMQSENEFYDGPRLSEEMALIEETLRANGITKVPITHNDFGPYGHFANTTAIGGVDLYGFDNYPNGFDCSYPTVWKEVTPTYEQDHNSVAPYTPLYLAEFQGGGFDPWAGPGYDSCRIFLNDRFANVFYKNNYAAGTTLQSLYMLYGGTNWGNLVEPGVYTSYDYAAPISEDRTLTPKYQELKLQGGFLHSSPAFLSSAKIGSAAALPYTNNTAIFTTHRRDTESEANFYFVRQTTNNNTSPVTFKLNVNTTAFGTVTVPQLGGSITLDGRESKVIVTNYKFGKNASRNIVYSTAEVFTSATIGDVDYIVLYAIAGQQVEIVLSTPKNVNPTYTSSSITARLVNTNETWIYGTTSSKVSVTSIGNDLKVLVIDRETAFTFWQPRLPAAGYALGPEAPSVLAWGPYLVRTASVEGSVLSLTGDTTAKGDIHVIAPPSVKSLKWNGTPVSLSTTELGGAKRATLGFKYAGAASSVPDLKSASWSCIDALPEITDAFDDSNWIVANKTSTQRPGVFQPIAGKYVLYADEYGFHQGDLLFRGHFSGKNATSVDLSVQGGTSFGYSAWLNSKFLGSNQGAAASVITFSGGIDLVNDTFKFNAADLKEENVLTVLVQSMGLDESWGDSDLLKSPRGVRGYTLHGAEFSTWKVQGNYLGEDAPDAVRGPLNEGGLWVERIGAHLPGYPTKGWTTSKSCTPYTGINKAGVQAYRTTFDLNIPAGADVPIALEFERTPSSNYRALVYINGWQYGRFSSNFGPQTIFQLPEGILNHRGKNELLVVLWSLDAEGAKIASLKLTPRAIFDSGKGTTPFIRSPTYAELRKA